MIKGTRVVAVISSGHVGQCSEYGANEMENQIQSKDARDVSDTTASTTAESLKLCKNKMRMDRRISGHHCEKQSVLLSYVIALAERQVERIEAVGNRHEEDGELGS